MEKPAKCQEMAKIDEIGDKPQIKPVDEVSTGPIESTTVKNVTVKEHTVVKMEADGVSLEPVENTLMSPKETIEEDNTKDIEGTIFSDVNCSQKAQQACDVNDF